MKSVELSFKTCFCWLLEICKEHCCKTLQLSVLESALSRPESSDIYQAHFFYRYVYVCCTIVVNLKDLFGTASQELNCVQCTVSVV